MKMMTHLYFLTILEPKGTLQRLILQTILIVDTGLRSEAWPIVHLTLSRRLTAAADWLVFYVGHSTTCG